MSECEGAFCGLPELIKQRSRGQQLNLVQRNRALSLLTGPNKSNFRGRGIDFEEVRIYQPGDDIRTIDWRVTARTGTAHTKLFREERERPVLIVADQSASMAFGSRNCFKSVLAAHVASMLAWAALDQGDRVGGLVFNDRSHSEIRPKRSRRSVLSLLNQLGEYNGKALESPPSSNALNLALAELRRIAKPGTSIYLISDFKGAVSADALDNLLHISRHCEITALHCADPMEAELPVSGQYRVTNGNTATDLFTGTQSLRRRYKEDYVAALELLRSQYRRLGIPMLEISTELEPLAQLIPYFGSRQSSSKQR